jgi:pimeloyl-ACP methyl ester carboxylesterase
MSFLNDGSDRIFYVEEGPKEAPPILMVHGSCGYSGQWRHLAEKLSAQYRVIRLDLPGMGDSDAMPIERQWTFAHDTRAVSAILDLIGAPVHFVGHSAGCAYAWRALADRPHLVHSLTLFEPVFFGLIESDAAFAFAKETGERYLELADAGQIESAIAFFVDRWAGRAGAWAAIPEKIKLLMMKGAGRLRHEWWTGLTDGFYPVDREAWLRELDDKPTLLVQGADTVPAAALVCSRSAELRPNTSMFKVPEAGHMVPFTHAAEVFEIVHGHLASSLDRPYE